MDEGAKCDLCHREVDTEVEGHSRGQWCDHELCTQCFVEHSIALRLAIRRKDPKLPGCPVCGSTGPPGELRERWAAEQWVAGEPEAAPDPQRPRLWPEFVAVVVLAAALIAFGMTG